MAVVTVVMPAYNHEKFIGAAVESVLAQTMDDWELVVVDDGSTDRTAEIVRSYKDPRLRLLQQTNCGAHHALNRGIDEATAPWIAILNSDDRFQRDKFERHLEIHRSDPLLEASACRVRYILESGIPASRYSYYCVQYKHLKSLSKTPLSLFASLLVANHLVTTSCLFVKRETLLGMGGFIGLRFVHDWFMFLALAQRGKLLVLEEELTDYRRHSMNTIAGNDTAGLIEDNFVLEWYVSRVFESDRPLLDISDLLGIMEKNRRLNFRLLFIFRLWRQVNSNDLVRCMQVFEDRHHWVLERCHEELRKTRVSRRIRRMRDRLKLFTGLVMDRM